MLASCVEDWVGKFGREICFFDNEFLVGSMMCMPIDKELVDGFVLESKGLVAYMTEILESCEGRFDQVQRLEDYGLNVDRIMGGAKSLAVMESDPNHLMHKVGDYAALCKAVGYKASQIRDNTTFYDICVALLLDATEILEEMIEMIENGKKITSVKDLVSKTLLDRLRWVSSQFSAEYRASVSAKQSDANKMNQNQIDDLLSKLGLDD